MGLGCAAAVGPGSRRHLQTTPWRSSSPSSFSSLPPPRPPASSSRGAAARPCQAPPAPAACCKKPWTRRRPKCGTPRSRIVVVFKRKAERLSITFVFKDSAATTWCLGRLRLSTRSTVFSNWCGCTKTLAREGSSQERFAFCSACGRSLFQRRPLAERLVEPLRAAAVLQQKKNVLN